MSREAFEQWYAEKHGFCGDTFLQNGDGSYLRLEVRWYFDLWQHQQSRIDALEEKNKELWERLQETSDQLVEFVHTTHAKVCTERDELKAELAATQETSAHNFDNLQHVFGWMLERGIVKSELLVESENRLQWAENVIACISSLEAELAAMKAQEPAAWRVDMPSETVAELIEYLTAGDEPEDTTICAGYSKDDNENISYTLNLLATEYPEEGCYPLMDLPEPARAAPQAPAQGEELQKLLNAAYAKGRDDANTAHQLVAQAPAQAVPDEIEPTLEAIKSILPTANPDEYACCIGADMWNACRKYMIDAQTPAAPVVDAYDWRTDNCKSCGKNACSMTHDLTKPPKKCLFCAAEWGNPAAQMVSERDVLESVAKTIYAQWKHHEGYLPWQNGGNSDKQYIARKLARAALNQPAIPEGMALISTVGVDMELMAGIEALQHCRASGFSTIQTIEVMRSAMLAAAQGGK